MIAPNDFGFGFMKSLANGKRIIFPTAWGDPQQSDFNLLSGGNGYDIQTKDGHWLFGEKALEQSSLASRSQDNNWVFTPEYLAGHLFAISESISRNTDRVVVDLATGLPYSDYNRGEVFRRKFIKCLKGEHEIQRKFGKQTITIRKVLVVPQNFSPIFRHLLDRDGEFHKPETEDDFILIGSINVGSYTVEFGTSKVVFSNRIDIDPIPPQCTSEPEGVYSLLPVVKPLLKEQFLGETFSDYKIIRALETGRIGVYNQKYPIKGIEDLADRYSKTIHDLATQNWSRSMPVKLNDLFALIVTGGGANLTAGYLKEIGYHPNIVVSDRPQWDTVEGYGRLKKLLDRRK